MRKRLDTDVSGFLAKWKPESKFYLFEEGGEPISYSTYWPKFVSRIPARLKITVWEEIDTEEIDARLSYGATFADTGWVIDAITIGKNVEVWSNNGQFSNERRVFDHGEKITVLAP